MASGRLGSAKVQPQQAALVYSNTSGAAAAVNIQATALTSTANANIGLAVDSASISLNTITTAATIPSGSMTQAVVWLDPLSSNTQPWKFDFISNTNENNTSNFPMSYWNGSTWVKAATGMFGSSSNIKIDPYFITNPSAYGKTTAQLLLPFHYTAAITNVRWRIYTNIATFTSTQLRTILLDRLDPGVTAYSASSDNANCGHAWANDMYTNWAIANPPNGATTIINPEDSSANSSYNQTVSMGYLLYGGNNPSAFVHSWIAPSILGSNGLFIMQATGYANSSGQINLVIIDPDFAAALGQNAMQAINYNSSGTSAAWWKVSLGTDVNRIAWFEYNPKDGRYYLECMQTGFVGIYSIDRAQLRLLPDTKRGASGTLFGFSNQTWIRKETAYTPWRAAGYFVTRPVRIDANTWWCVSNQNIAYVSTDLVNWTVATEYYQTLGAPSNTYLQTPLTNTSYLSAQDATANTKKVVSNYASVSDISTLEYNTSITNYQRTGVVISNGDKLYLQNYSPNVAVSVTAMGYEGS
jgi:hypothetical protein